MTHNQSPEDGQPGAPFHPADSPQRPAALRALAEAAERRRALEVQSGTPPIPSEVGGRPGPDPVRYGDWEKGGIVSDF